MIGNFDKINKKEINIKESWYGRFAIYKVHNSKSEIWKSTMYTSMGPTSILKGILHLESHYNTQNI